MYNFLHRPTVSFQEVRDTGVDGRVQSLADLEASAYRKRSVTHADGDGLAHAHEKA